MNDLEILNPDNSGKVTIDGDDWRNVINFIYSSIVDCSDPLVKNKFCTMKLADLQSATKEAMAADLKKIADNALEAAYKEKYEDPDLRAILLKTGTIRLKSPLLSCVTSMKSATLEEATELMKCRSKLSENMNHRNADRDEQAYIKRVKQAIRIKKAMTKMLRDGNSLERFKHFSIASIPTELAHTGDTSPESIEKVAPEVKSAALCLNGNILYNLVRRQELRKYRDQMISLKGAVAKACVATYILNTKYPHFFKEAVNKHTGNLKSQIYTTRLSLENNLLDTAAKRELVDNLEQKQNKLRDKKTSMTKARVYKKHTELLDSIPKINEKVWTLYEKKKFPEEVQTDIAAKIVRLYEPTTLEIEQSEGWTHRCQKFTRTDENSTQKKAEIGEYVISRKEFPELTVEYEIQMSIDGRCFSSAAHYILFRLLVSVLALRLDNQEAETKAEQALLGVTGKFSGVQKGTKVYIELRDETFEMLLRQACEKGVEAWIKQSTEAKKALKEHAGKIIYKSTNYILGSGPVGSAKAGQNLVGKTLEKLKRTFKN
jgi:hypothetical protein